MNNILQTIPITFTDEVWVKITDDIIPNIKPYYYISNYGYVISEQSNSFLYSVINSGYVKVTLYTYDGGVDLLMHRLVMMVFSPNPNANILQVNHIDGNKLNNKLNNLEWVTQTENLIHAYDHNLMTSGENHMWAKLNNEQVHTICKGLEQRFSYKYICEQMLNIEYDHNMRCVIGLIKNGQNWRQISKLYDIPSCKRNNQTFTDEQAEFICQALSNNEKPKTILTLLGYYINNMDKNIITNYISTINKIKRKERYTHISNKYF